VTSLRWQLPVWSPLTLGSVAAGIFPKADALDALERRIREEYGAAGVMLTGSGTVALALAYMASAPSGSRPRVALPAWACPDLMTAADAVGAEVVLYDLNPSTLSPDLESVRRALEGGATAVVAAHWFGLPLELSPIRELAASAGALLIDDAAQGMGASIKGRPVGVGGDLGVLSFGRGKGRTGGGGGALLANTPETARRLTELGPVLFPARGGVGKVAALFGQWALGRPLLYGIPMRVPALKLGQTVYHAPPDLRRLSPQSATVLSSVWGLSREEVAIRRSNADQWRKFLSENPEIAMYGAPAGTEPGWLRFPVRISDRLLSTFRNSMMSRHGVSAGYPSLLCDLPLSKGRLAGPTEGFPGGLLLSRNLFTLPVHSRVRSEDVHVILRCVQ
jgi:perosamine synthetase